MAHTSAEAVANEESHPSTGSEVFLRNGVDIRVSNREGYLCKMYALLTHADNSAIFKSIDAVSARKVHLDTPARKEVYIEQTSTVGLLFFKRQFTTALNVVESPEEMTASFDLAKPGVMAAFKGCWHLEPVPAEQYRELVKDRTRPHHWNRSLASPNDQDKTLFTVDQDVAPAIAEKMPPWLHGFLRRICAAAVNDIYQDMGVVAELRYRGVPMDQILQSKIHGRGGLIRKVLCAKPQPGPPEHAAKDDAAKPGPAVGSHAIHVAAAGDSSSGGVEEERLQG